MVKKLGPKFLRKKIKTLVIINHKIITKTIPKKEKFQKNSDIKLIGNEPPTSLNSIL